MTVTPTVPIHLDIRKDGAAAGQGLFAEPLEIEADTEVEVGITNIATVRVRGGRREAQERVRSLEDRWAAEALPHLTAAGVEDLDALDGKVSEARDLDSHIKTLDGNLESLKHRLSALAGADEALRQASGRRIALGNVELESLAADLDALGPDPGATLRTRRHQAAQAADRARTLAGEAATAQALAEERAKNLVATLDEAIKARESVLSSGAATEAAAARSV